jgi:hypothetical protein
MAEITSQTNGLDQGFSQTSASGAVVADSEALAVDYAFDARQFEIAIEVRRGDVTYHFAHRLRRPTLEELLERERAITYEVVEVDSRQDVIHFDVEAANARLWDRIAEAVQGYDFGDGVSAGYGAEGFRPVQERERERMLGTHKSRVILGLYTDETEPIEDDGFSLDSIRIRQTFGTVARSAVIHTLRLPTEAERIKFKARSTSTQFVRGARKRHETIRSDLKTFVGFYDLLLLDIQGGTVDGAGYSTARRGPFLAAIDPMWKRSVVQSLVNSLEANLKD